MSWNSAPSFSRLSRNRSSANLRALSPSALSRGRTRWCRPRTRVDGPRGFPHACTGSGWRSQARVELSVVCQFGSDICSMLSITRVLCLSTMRCSGRCLTASANAARPSFESAEAESVCSSRAPARSHCSTERGGVARPQSAPIEAGEQNGTCVNAPSAAAGNRRAVMRRPR
jgi:hypothetical protein